MAQIYKEGEIKVRPDVYYRYSNKGAAKTAAIDGINAIVVKAPWGPIDEVRAFNDIEDIKAVYGTCIGTEAATAILEEGASKVYIYRTGGTGGAKASAKVGNVTVNAKYEGDYPLKIKIQKKPGDDTIKQCYVLINNGIKESFNFTAGESDSTELTKTLSASDYVDVSDASAPEAVAETEVELSGGKNPTVTAESYTKGFYALEPYYYNVISVDTIEDSIQELLAEYVNDAARIGKFAIAVLGADQTLSLSQRVNKAKSYNKEQIALIGNTYTHTDGTTADMILSVARLAGAVSATPSNKSIVHRAIKNASDIPEKFTNSQYEEAIQGGVILFSKNSDGQIWFDSGVTTLTILDENQDAGWKKLKRTKVRNELMHRLDLLLEKKVGRVNCDADGLADVIQTGMGLLKDMANENKIMGNGAFILDSANPATSDSAWFLIEVDDIDTLEKIYLHYRFSNVPTA